MSMSKSKFFSLIIGLGLFVFTPLTFAHAATIAELQAQVQAMLAQITSLQQQLSQQQTGQQSSADRSSSVTTAVSDSSGALPYVEGEVLVTFKSPDGGDAQLDEKSFDSKTQTLEDSFNISAVKKIIAGKTVLFKTKKNGR